MSHNWVELSKSGQLIYLYFNSGSEYCIRKPHNEDEEFVSIVKYVEADNSIVAMTKLGELKTIPLPANNEKTASCKNPAIVDEMLWPLRTLNFYNGFLRNRRYYPISHFHIKDFMLTKIQKIILDNGNVIQHPYKGLPEKESNRHYCTTGIMKEAKCLRHQRIGLYFRILETTDNELFVISEGSPDPINIWVKDDFILVILDEWRVSGRRIHADFKGKELSHIYYVNRHINMAQSTAGHLLNIFDVTSVVQRDNNLTITTSGGEVHNMTTDEASARIYAFAPINVNSDWERRALYYVASSGALIDLRSEMAIHHYSFHLINGKYLDNKYEPLPVLAQYKFPVTNGVLIAVNFITRIGNTFIINDIFTVLSKHAMEISNIEISEESDVYSLLITTAERGKRAAVLFARLNTELADMRIIFEDGDVWPLVEPGALYSPEGPYDQIPISEVQHLKGPVYVIRGDYVVFDTLISDNPIFSLYTCFGNYLAYTQAAAYIGAITIHRPHTHTKAAVAF